MVRSKKDDDERSHQETERIREATLKRLLNTPPKRHAELLKERRIKRGQQKPPAQRKGS